MEEVFAIYNEKEKIIGAATRTEAHRKGLWHMVVHCWLLYRTGNEVWLYFQQRADSKKDFPSLYDIAAAGHVDVSEFPKQAVLRETKEEIGLEMDERRLYHLGTLKEEIRLDGFWDREIVQVYLYESQEEPKFTLGEEVSRMIRIPQKEFEKKELHGEESLTAFLMNKRKIVIPKEEWCKHSGEYKKWVLPWLKKHPPLENLPQNVAVQMDFRDKLT